MKLKKISIYHILVKPSPIFTAPHRKKEILQTWSLSVKNLPKTTEVMLSCMHIVSMYAYLASMMQCTQTQCDTQKLCVSFADLSRYWWDKKNTTFIYLFIFLSKSSDRITPISDIQCQFSMSKIIRIFLSFFHCRILI